MATASQWNKLENNDGCTDVFKTSVEQKVRFKSGLPDDSSTDDESGPPEEEKRSTEQRSSSNHCISSRIHKRKMPVRRPTAYVSDKNAAEGKNDEEEENEKEQQATTHDGPTNFSTLDQKLRELSMKYKQQECSPERTKSATLTRSAKTSCGP